MGYLNATALNKLPKATRQSKGIEAVLLEYDISGAAPKPLWIFLVNPQSLKFSKSARYNEIFPLASKQSELQYSSTEGQTLSIADLTLTTWYEGKSLKPVLEGITKLLEADINNKKYSPPVLKFQMGSRTFAPCVLTKIDWQETAWLGGEPATVKLSLELKEIAKVVSRGQIESARDTRLRNALNQREQSGRPRTRLTDRQRAETSATAKKYLESNVSVWSAEVQAAVKGKKYKVTTNADTGEIKLIGANNKQLGLIGKTDGKVFGAGEKVTTIPTLQGKKPPSTK